MSDQPVAETSTYTGQHNRQTSMPRAGFESRDPSNQAATGNGCNISYVT
jgi:hypothetical protein